MKYKKWIFILVGIVAYLSIIQLSKATGQKNLEYAARQKQLLSVSVITPEEKQVWIDYLTDRLNHKIKPTGSQLIIDNLYPLKMANGNEPTILSKTTPYKIDCYDFSGITIQFGQGESIEGVKIDTIQLDDGVLQTPHKSFVEGSEADKKLKKILCEVTMNYMSDVTSIDFRPDINLGRNENK